MAVPPQLLASLSGGSGGLKLETSNKSGDIKSAFGDRIRTSGISTAPNWGMSQGAMMAVALAAVAVVFIVMRKGR